VEAQHPRARVARGETLAHDAGPHPPRGSELGRLLEQVVVAVEEEGQAGSEPVDAEARPQRRRDVLDAVGQREGHLLDGGGPGFAQVIAADRDGVPPGTSAAQ